VLLVSIAENSVFLCEATTERRAVSLAVGGVVGYVLGVGSIGTMWSMSPRLLSDTMISPIVCLNACDISPCIDVDIHATANAMNIETTVSRWTICGCCRVCVCIIAFCMVPGWMCYI